MSSTTNNVRSSQTLNDAGQFTNGALANVAMVTAMQPVFKLKTYFMNGGAFSLTAVAQAFSPYQVSGTLREAYRGYACNSVSIVPAGAVGFLVNGAVLRYLAPNRQPTKREQVAACVAGGVVGAPLAAAFERPMILQQVNRVSATGALRSVAAAEAARGAFTGSAAPLYRVLRQRNVSERNQARVENAVETARVAAQCARGLRKGVLLTGCRDAGVLYGLMGLTDDVEANLPAAVSNERVRQVTASAVTGALVGAATAPVDVVKTRMQSALQGSNSVLETTRNVVQTEGVRALVKGAGTRATLIGGAMVLLGRAKGFFPPHLPECMHRDPTPRASV